MPLVEFRHCGPPKLNASIRFRFASPDDSVGCGDKFCTYDEIEGESGASFGNVTHAFRSVTHLASASRQVHDFDQVALSPSQSWDKR